MLRARNNEQYFSTPEKGFTVLFVFLHAIEISRGLNSQTVSITDVFVAYRQEHRTEDLRRPIGLGINSQRIL